MEDELLLITLGENQFSLELEEVSHIVELPPQTLQPIPLAPFPILGLAYALGKVITVVDLAAAMNLTPIDLRTPHPLLVLANQNRELGFLLNNMGQLKTSIPTALLNQTDIDQATVTNSAPGPDLSQVQALPLTHILNTLKQSVQTAKEVAYGN